MASQPNLQSSLATCLLARGTVLCLALFLLSPGTHGVHLKGQAGSGNTGGTLLTATHFGAVGDGRMDDSAALLRAFQGLCSAPAFSTLLLPAGKTFLVRKALQFKGPCTGHPLYIQIEGKVQFDARGVTTNYLWEFRSINQLRVSGKGTVDGKGPDWWPMGGKRPCLLQFIHSDGLKVSGITTQNPPMVHINLQWSKGIMVQGVRTNAPADSPNTDSIHIGQCNGVFVTASSLHSGDDCVSIVGDTSNVLVQGVSCTAGHGYSIGSLGLRGETVCLNNITVADSSLTDTTNGVRIKTYQGGNGMVSNVNFRNIRMTRVRKPIIIDQFYCDKQPCSSGNGAVALFNIKYQGIKGTTVDPSQAGGVTVRCSASTPCSNVVFDQVDIWSVVPTRPLYPQVSSAYGKTLTVRSPGGLKTAGTVPSGSQESNIRSQAAKCGLQRVAFAG